MPRRSKSVLLKHVLVSTFVLWLLIGVGVLFAVPVAVHFSLFRPDLNGHTVKAVAEVFQATLNGRMPEQVAKTVVDPKYVNERSGDIFIADDNGQILAGSFGATADFTVEKRLLPTEPMLVSSLTEQPPPPGAPAIVRLQGTPVRYLIFQPVQRTHPEQVVMIAVFAASTIIIFLAIGISSLILLKKLRSHSRQVGTIMGRMEQGELGARLKIEQLDEFGVLMQQFNFMADKVEKLFHELKESQMARLRFLQDVSHDLRTPLGSLLNLFELLRENADRILPAERQTLLSTGRREVKFTQHLVDDLLFLARYDDSACVVAENSLDLFALVQEEVDAKRVLTSVEISLACAGAVKVVADAQLLQRLIRNALENSISFAQNSVKVLVEQQHGAVLLQFEDDGPGFSAESLKSFGLKRPTRILQQENGQRISLGLGSVIMVTIAKIYYGKVKPDNRIHDGQIIGGQVSIWLNLPHASTSSLIVA